MTPNISKDNIPFKNNSPLSPQDFFIAEGSNLVSNQHEVNNNNYSANGSKMYTCMAGTSNLTWNNCQLVLVFFSKIASVPF